MGLFNLDDNFTSPQSEEKRGQEEGHMRTHLKAKVYELTPKFLYRRAFSESSLLDALAAPGFNFENGHVYNFITGGDIDSLSFLKAILRQQPLDYCIASTWCMGSGDILQFREWAETGSIRHLDIYVGEIFAGTYSTEWSMLQDIYKDHPALGRLALFRNHSKIFAGTGPLFSFGVQSSANINTNPRTEQASVTIDEGIYRFYRDYFDGIKSFI